MKVKININGVDVEIQLTPEQEALALKQTKPKFEWNYTVNSTFHLSEHIIDKFRSGDVKVLVEHGRYRKSQQAAKQALARNKRANRLEALAEQLKGLIEFRPHSINYYVYYSETQKVWRAATQSIEVCPERVYMTAECVTEICRMLNVGEFSLDNEL